MDNHLSNEQKKVILKIAKEAIKEAVLNKKIVSRDELVTEYPWLKEKGAVFVTINKLNNLRGCIGSLVARRSLIDDIVYNAKAAALDDPRFEPLSPDELDNIEVEVSLLTSPKPLPYSDVNDLRTKIRPGVDGVILKYDGYQATYLPSVWEQLPGFEMFFSSLCQKAGLPDDCLELHPEIYTYEAIKIINS